MRNNRTNIPRLTTLRNNSRNARTRRQPRSNNLRAHPASSQRTPRRTNIRLQFRDILDYSNTLCIRICPWVLIIQAIHIRHKKQIVCLYHPRRNRTQRVVVTKLNLRHSQCIVLIDNRYNPHTQQLNERILRILILCPIRNIVPREQYLCNRLLQVAK